MVTKENGLNGVKMVAAGDHQDAAKTKKKSRFGQIYFLSVKTL
jgi:hypothetical protein